MDSFEKLSILDANPRTTKYSQKSSISWCLVKVSLTLARFAMSCYKLLSEAKFATLWLLWSTIFVEVGWIPFQDDVNWAVQLGIFIGDVNISLITTVDHTNVTRSILLMNENESRQRKEVLSGHLNMFQVVSSCSERNGKLLHIPLSQWSKSLGIYFC